MKKYQGYWAAEQPMTPKQFCERMGDATCTHVGGEPGYNYEVRIVTAGHVVRCLAGSPQAAWRKAAEEIDRE